MLVNIGMIYFGQEAYAGRNHWVGLWNEKLELEDPTWHLVSV